MPPKKQIKKPKATPKPKVKKYQKQRQNQKQSVNVVVNNKTTASRSRSRSAPFSAPAQRAPAVASFGTTFVDRQTPQAIDNSQINKLNSNLQNATQQLFHYQQGTPIRTAAPATKIPATKQPASKIPAKKVKVAPRRRVNQDPDETFSMADVYNKKSTVTPKKNPARDTNTTTSERNSLFSELSSALKSKLKPSQIKNNKAFEDSLSAASAASAATKRGVGRPKGAKDSVPRKPRVVTGREISSAQAEMMTENGPVSVDSFPSTPQGVEEYNNKPLPKDDNLFTE